MTALRTTSPRTTGLGARPSLATAFAFFGLASLGTACNLDPAVFVEPAIESPRLALTGGVLGSSLTGEFTLTLHLGARASGPSEVAFGAFSLVDANGEVVLDGLPVAPSRPSPIAVEPDSDELVVFTIDSGDEPIDDALATAICAGEIAIRGTLEDSLESGSSPVESDLFAATGCP
jgi:hypothetical protein